nr:MAG TPA: hypothetical protein [Caudoviricetes sp.]DAW93942.1 MAG TPA: hypothetical protein [Caudoviricetes sp.]
MFFNSLTSFCKAIISSFSFAGLSFIPNLSRRA